MKNPLNRGGIRFALTLLALAAGRTTGHSLLFGAPFVLLGVALHIWAKGCLEQNRTVTRSGPYRYVRHPFYLANGLIDAGIVLMSNWWVLQAFALFWWIGVYFPVMAREERHLKDLFGDAWRAYAARVPMLLPRRRPIPATGNGFSLRNRNIAEGREISRALHILAYPFLLFGVSEMRRGGLRGWMDNNAPEFLMLVMAGALYVLAWESERHTKGQRRILPESLTGDQARVLFAGLMVALCAAVRCFETELDHIVLPAGGGIIIMALLLGQRVRQPLAECISLVGLAVMCEVLWLAPLPIIYYAAVLLDYRLEGKREPFPLLSAYANGWLPTLYITVSIAKEVAFG